mmetsp:Transcript_7001/g.10195  ORF Transcript_7001/g.10195 Transcript_7001/m.10195 type:complete len:653 (+) Transcript_7001:1286-3244(+)
MSLQEKSSGRQGGLPEAGVFRPIKRKVRAHKKQETVGGKGSIKNYFKPKPRSTGGTESEEPQAKVLQEIKTGEKRKHTKGWRSTGRRYQKQKPKSTYTMTYSKINLTGKQEEKPKRMTQGELPTYTTQNGETSTTFGHTVETIDNRTTFRAIFQNPNGINPSPGNYQFTLSLKECYDNCISLIGLSETNREWQKPEQQKQLKEAMHKTWSASIVQTSTSRETFEDNYKPGGTTTSICEDHWVCRVRERGEDPWGLGRWSWALLSGKGSKKVLSVNGYRVCKSSVTRAGETTAYKQQYNILRERLNGKIDPSCQFVLDLQTWLAFYIAMGCDIILYLDGNEDISKIIGKWLELSQYQPGKHAINEEHDGSLATLVTTCGLLDVLVEQHGQQIPPTYTRGTKRLDYVFVTPGIMDSVLRSTLLPFHTIFGGDHRPILIDFDATKLFGDTSHEIQRQASRGLCLQDPRIVNRYLELVEKQMHYHKIYDKVMQLKEKSEDSKWAKQCVMKYEKIDNIITASVRYADKQVAKRYSTQYEWSPELMRAVNEARYWELRLKPYKGIKMDEGTLEQHREAAKLPLQQSKNIEGRLKVVDCLRAARKQMQEFQRRHVEMRSNYLEELAEAKVIQHRPWLNEEGNEQRLREQKEKQIKELIK